MCSVAVSRGARTCEHLRHDDSRRMDGCCEMPLSRLAEQVVQGPSPRSVGFDCRILQSMHSHDGSIAPGGTWAYVGYALALAPPPGLESQTITGGEQGLPDSNDLVPRSLWSAGRWSADARSSMMPYSLQTGRRAGLHQIAIAEKNL